MNQATWLARLERILSLNCQEPKSDVMESSHVINSGFRDQSIYIYKVYILKIELLTLNRYLDLYAKSIYVTILYHNLGSGPDNCISDNIY